MHCPLLPPTNRNGSGYGGGNAPLGSAPSPELIDRYSNEMQVTGRTPPAYLAHAKNDRTVHPDHSRLFAEEMTAKGCRVTCLELPSGDHGLNQYKGPMWDAWQEGVIV